MEFIRNPPVRRVTQCSAEESASSHIKVGNILHLKQDGNGASPVSSGICLPMRLLAQWLIDIPVNLQNEALIITPTAQRKERSFVVCEEANRGDLYSGLGHFHILIKILKY